MEFISEERVMKKILWISQFAPYDEVGHAGGKNHNYYLKYIVSQRKFDVKLLSMCNSDEIEKIDLDKFGIKNDIFFCKLDRKIGRLIKMIINIESELNPFNKYHNILSNYRKFCFTKLIKRNISDIISADIIIMQWTGSLFMYPFIRRYAKDNARFVILEEDVSYLGYQRKYRQSKNLLSKIYWKVQYKGLKEREISLLKKCNLIVTTNKKDLKLLQKEEIPLNRLYNINSYYDNYSHVKRNNIRKNMILYYGAMNRKENYSAVIWFAKEVMPLLDKQFQLFVIGNKPNKQLLKLKSERIIIEGFVKEIDEYFSQCLCIVVPLLIGAGIKIKVLEAMSAGIPVLTNDIGIEGIYAEDNVQYLHCNTQKEYATKIQLLAENENDGYTLGQNAKAFIQENFNTQKSADELINTLEYM